MKNSQKDTKDSQEKVVDEQSLYQYLKSLFPFKTIIVLESIILGYGFLFGIPVWGSTGESSLFWIIIGIGQVLLLIVVILNIRNYSAMQVVQKMKEKSTIVEPDPSEATQDKVIDDWGNSPEFKIRATYAIDIPKLSASEQEVFESLSRSLKLEYVLWSVNIYTLIVVPVLLAFYNFAIPDANPVYPICELSFFIPLLLFFPGTSDRGNKAAKLVKFPHPHLSAKEPRGLKIGLIVYIVFRAVLFILYGRLNSFSFTIIAFALTVNICVSISLYGLRWRVKRQGFPKINMLALWVFGTQAIWDLLENHIIPVWRKLGNIFLIRGGEHILTQVSLWDSWLFLRGKDRIISKTPQQITQKLNEFQERAKRSLEYRFNTLLCGDNSWQFALHSLIDDADLVVMQLSNFSPSNQGCIYELEQLINRVPVENFYLLVDRHSTDYDFLLEKLQELWKKMKANSPNQDEQSQGIQIIFLEDAVKTPDEVEIIYGQINAGQQDGMAVLEDDPHKKELVIQHETRRRQELEGLFRALFAKAIQLRITS